MQSSTPAAAAAAAVCRSTCWGDHGFVGRLVSACRPRRRGVAHPWKNLPLGGRSKVPRSWSITPGVKRRAAAVAVRHWSGQAHGRLDLLELLMRGRRLSEHGEARAAIRNRRKLRGSVR